MENIVTWKAVSQRHEVNLFKATMKPVAIELNGETTTQLIIKASVIDYLKLCS